MKGECCGLFFGIFQGFVISDWLGIDRITSPSHSNYSYSIQVGVGAGIDMVTKEKNILSLVSKI